MMANDIAALGLSMDSKPLDQSTAALDKFAASAKTAEKGLEGQAQRTGAATQQMGRSVARTASFAQELNKFMGVRNGFASAERAADVAAYGQELDNLRAKFNPLYAVQQR